MTAGVRVQAPIPSRGPAEPLTNHVQTPGATQSPRIQRFDINSSQQATSSGTQVHQTDSNTLQIPQRDPSPAPSTASVMVDNTTFVQPPTNYKPEFPWRRVGTFIDADDPPPFEELLELSSSKNAAKLAKYISEKYYADLYWNCSLAVGMCFFSWALSYCGFGMLSFAVATLFGFAVYRVEFRRFNLNIRDDMQRVYAADHLEQKLESMHWLNNFLSKFWVIYMPALSDMVIQQTNEILKTVEPPPPINKLSLQEFTLGSKAPKVESIKSFTKLGPDLYQMDWDLNFTPNDTNDMTANELKNKIAPKIALGIRVGKGFVGASLPVLVEDMSFEGLLRIKLKIGDTFPHIDVVSICFLEQPTIDYALKPVGGNTFGIDIMSLIPGLSSFVNGLIHSNLAPMLYAPNSLDINVNDIVESTLPSAIGALGVKIRGAEYLSDSKDLVINPYVEFNTEYGAECDKLSTDIKANTSVPIFNEVKHMLINNLQSRLKFKLMNLKKSGESTQLAEAYFELQDLLQNNEMKMIETKLIQNNRNVGKLVYDLVWFPVLKSDDQLESTDIVTKQPESDTGIFDFNLIASRDLDSSKSLIGKLSTYAEIYIDNTLLITSRLAKGTNNPEFKCKLEKLINSKAASIFKILIKDISSFGETTIAQYETTNIEDLIFISTKKSHKLNFTKGAGSFIFSSVWKPLPSMEVHEDFSFIPPMGVLRVNVLKATNLPNLETLGTIDPYVQILSGGLLKAESSVVKNTLNPEFMEVFYVSLSTKNERVKLRVMDVESGDSDREVGSLKIDLLPLLANPNKQLKYQGALSRNGRSTGEISYEISYCPLLPIYSHREIQHIIAKQKDDNQVDDLDELEEQAKFLEDFKKHPDDYEWVEEEGDSFQEQLIKQGKIMMSITDAIKNKSGVLGINLIKGSTKQKSCFIEALIDDRIYADFTSRKANNGKFSSHSGDAFIRDLPNSIITFRLTKSARVKNNEQVISMGEPLKVIDLLKDGYEKAVKIDIAGNSIEFMFEFIPAEVGTSASDSITDTGLLSIKLLRGFNLPAADKNGYSDPYIVLTSNGVETFRTKTIKKTLNPEWNESTQLTVKSRERTKFIINVLDWDMAGKNDTLGTIAFNLNDMDIEKTENWKLPLDSNNSSSFVEFETKFSPGYIRAGFGVVTSSGLKLPDATGAVGDLGALGLNTATNITGGALNVAGGAAMGAAHVSNGLLKRLHVQKRTSSSSFRPMPPPQVNNGSQHSKSSSIGGGTMSVRSSMDVASVNTETFHGANVVTGRMSIINLTGCNDGSYQLKVEMMSPSNKKKSLHKTKPVKSSDGEVKWHEQCALRCDPRGCLILEVREHHVLGKDKVIASEKLQLSDIMGTKEDVSLKTAAGEIHLNFNYGI